MSDEIPADLIEAGRDALANGPPDYGLVESILAAVLPLHRGQLLTDAASKLRANNESMGDDEDGLAPGIEYAADYLDGLAATRSTGQTGSQ